MLRTTLLAPVLSVLVLSASASLAAAQAFPAVAPGTSRAFAASYTLSDIEDEGSSVHVTMALTLENPGAHDVKGGIVAVFSGQPRALLLGSFPAIKVLAHQGRTTLTHTFTVTAAEYASWQRGHEPVLQFLVPATGPDGENTAVVEGIQSHQVALPPPPRNGSGE